MAVKADAAKQLADYILQWLERRNAGEFADVLGGQRVTDARLMRSELELILEHEGKPPNWRQ